MEQLDLKDSCRDLQINCAISYLFYLYLMFHACAARFDMMGNLVKFWVLGCIKTRPKSKACPIGGSTPTLHTQEAKGTS